jgi:hypothetical protein
VKGVDPRVKTTVTPDELDALYVGDGVDGFVVEGLATVGE